ncbi:MAG: hypothetical protein ACJATI_002788 [Halioglobus sp.]|jgi:hypothetical protein
MKNKILAVIGILIFAFVLYTYFTTLKEDYYIDGDSDIVVVSADGQIPDRVELPQAWNSDTRNDFWYTSQGSEIMPYDWFTWLEQSDNEKLIRNAQFMESLGYLPQASSKQNPSGLPIGFAITRARETKERGVGFTCAGCHTNQIDYNGSKILVEGAPTLANFVGLYGEIVKSLHNTQLDDTKFERFAQRVLKDKYNQDAAEDLREQVKEKARSTAERQAVNALPLDYPADFTSYGRLDAFGNIMNAGTAFGLDKLANKNFPTGPVSYPFLWGTHQSDVVQWNASAPNTPVVGPLARNVGEVVGVFGGLSIHEAPWWQQLIGIDVAYSSTVDFKGLGELESWIMDLRSPAWPEKILPPINAEKVAQGSIIFADKCQSCHKVMSRSQEGELYVSNKTLLSEIGTDPITAWNAHNYQAKTFFLEGQKQDILLGDTFDIKTAAIDIPVNGAIGVVLKRPIKAIEAGLAPGKHAGVEASKSALIEMITEHLKKSNEIESSKDDDTSTKQVPTALGPGSEPIDLDKLVYKGRPLNGIWATAPYLHNGSVPNLWELLQVPAQRVKEFHVGNRNFDDVNVGFDIMSGPSVFKVMKSDSTIMPGNSNLGHAYGTGLSDDDKWALIEYMKSL